MPARYAEHDVSRYPAQVSSISWHLLDDGYTITRAPAPGRVQPHHRQARAARRARRLPRRRPRNAARLGRGPDAARPGEPLAAASSTREAPGSPRGRARLYRVVQYYYSRPFENDSRVPHGSKSRRRTETFRTLGPVKQRLARANGHAQYQRQNGGDWSAFVAMAEQPKRAANGG